MQVTSGEAAHCAELCNPENPELQGVLRAPKEPATAAGERSLCSGCISELGKGETHLRGKEKGPEQWEHLSSHLGSALSLVWCQRSGLTSSTVDLSCDGWNNNGNLEGQEA